MGPATPWRVLAVWALGLATWAAVSAPELNGRLAGSELGPWRDAQLAALAPFVAVREMRSRPSAVAASEQASLPSPTPLVTAAPSAQPAPTPIPTPTPTPAPTPRRRPTARSPLRVLVVGDSIATDLGWALQSSDTPPLKVTLDTRPATGLARPDHFDWQAQLAADVERDQPELVVVMLGGNDSQGFLVGDRPVLRGTTEWRASYAERVRRLMALARAGGRDVLWVGMPIMEDPDFADQMRVINGVYKAEAAIAGVTYVDAWALFADAAGRYAPFLPDPAGRPQAVRQPDGIHLSMTGAARLAAHVLEIAAARWHLG